MKNTSKQVAKAPSKATAKKPATKGKAQCKSAAPKKAPAPQREVKVAAKPVKYHVPAVVVDGRTYQEAADGKLLLAVSNPYMLNLYKSNNRALVHAQQLAKQQFKLSDHAKPTTVSYSLED